MRIYFLILATGLLFFSCGSKKEKPQEKEATEVLDEVEEEIPDEAIDTLETMVEETTGTPSLYQQFSSNRDSILQLLPTLSKEQANALYTAYKEANYKLIAKITDRESKILERFYHEHDSDKSKIQNLEYTFREHLLEFDEMGEGYVEIKTKPNFYYSLFKDYVTPDYKQYLYLKSEENIKRYSADAGLMISFKEIGDRILSWEKFLSNFPDSPLFKEVKADYLYYQKDYLLGLDNTPTLETTGKGSPYIYEENQLEFARFINTYPDSPTTPLIAFFLNNYQTEPRGKLIQEEQKRLYP